MGWPPSEKAALSPHERFRRFLDDVQFLLGRGDRAFVNDLMAQVAYRRQWITERDAYDRPADDEGCAHKR